MEKRITNPWKWQDNRNYAQAVEVIEPTATLYISGQTAINDDGISSNADMKTQLIIAIQNLEKVILQAGFKLSGIARLNIYTTNTVALWECFPIFQEWIIKNNIEQTLTLLEVKSLFETLSVELEATVVR